MKRMTFNHNKTLDQLLLVASCLRNNKAAQAEKTLADLIEDESDQVEEDLEALNALQEAAWQEATMSDDDMDSDEDDTMDDDDEVMSEMEIDEDADDAVDESDDDLLDDDAVEQASLKRKAGRARRPAAAKAHRVVANVEMLRRRSRKRR